MLSVRTLFRARALPLSRLSHIPRVSFASTQKIDLGKKENQGLNVQGLQTSGEELPEGSLSDLKIDPSRTSPQYKTSSEKSSNKPRFANLEECRQASKASQSDNLGLTSNVTAGKGTKVGAGTQVPNNTFTQQRRGFASMQKKGKSAGKDNLTDAGSNISKGSLRTDVDKKGMSGLKGAQNLTPEMEQVKDNLGASAGGRDLIQEQGKKEKHVGGVDIQLESGPKFEIGATQVQHARERGLDKPSQTLGSALGEHTGASSMRMGLNVESDDTLQHQAKGAANPELDLSMDATSRIDPHLKNRQDLNSNHSSANPDMATKRTKAWSDGSFLKDDPAKLERAYEQDAEPELFDAEQTMQKLDQSGLKVDHANTKTANGQVLTYPWSTSGKQTGQWSQGFDARTERTEGLNEAREHGMMGAARKTAEDLTRQHGGAVAGSMNASSGTQWTNQTTDKLNTMADNASTTMGSMMDKAKDKLADAAELMGAKASDLKEKLSSKMSDMKEDLSAKMKDMNTSDNMGSLGSDKKRLDSLEKNEQSDLAGKWDSDKASNKRV